ncbi:MAG TPA: carboxypeptidase-like regulatory domain-containing protein [Vicinamibacterales bacterium]|nr:carboxypeptidase-like regulatory domain-containing protein [Vicinamibacterales bacterium]
MRRLTAVTLAIATIFLGIPSTSAAQQAQAASISGQAVDAAGRALALQRVELVRTGEVVQTTTTNTRGEWSFTGVQPGAYIVRLTINGQVAGVRVEVTAGQALTNTVIVAPSAAAPSAAFLFALPLLAAIGTVAAVAAAVITTVVVVTGS